MEKAAPSLGSVVQVSASGDRFVGKHQTELFATLSELCARAERVDIPGGHISTLFKRDEVIVPAIVAAFDRLDGVVASGNATEAPMAAEAPRRA
jgi:putative intracellular protease/amidase